MDSRAPDGGWIPESRFVGALDVPVDLPLAAVGTRGLAVLLDSIIILLVDAFLLAAVTLSAGALQELARWTLLAVVLGLFVVHYGYFALCEWLMDGQTPGKRVLGIRVVESDGTRIGPLSALIRNLIRMIDFLPFGFGVGVATIFLSERCQRLGDMAAGTLVVREDEPPRAELGLPGLDELTPQEISLLEQYLAVRDGMLAERREHVARALIEWLIRRHPGIASRLPDLSSPALALDVLLGAAPPDRVERD
ncbi:MAG: RDD family protein [Acidobacteria bacterium]|nr:MAG: RDD family protein [Acidobacteriota bacterium]